MRFWDTSALVPILVEEETTVGVRDLLRADPAIMISWTTRVECASALCREERAGVSIDEAWQRLEVLAASWHVVEPTERLRQVAVRLLRVHPLRAADAFQLAAAIVASEGEPRTLPLVTLDDRLADAATREGFPIVRPVPARL